MGERERFGRASASSFNVTGYTPQGLGIRKVARVPFVGGTDTAGGVFAFENPERGPIVVEKVILDVLTVATAACSLEVGGAANGTTAASGMISSQDVHSATGSFGSTVGTTRVAAGAFITGSTVSGASAGLIGNAYIEYIIL